MEDFAKKYLAWYQGLSKVVRAILCLLWDVPSNLCRFSKSALKDNTLGVVLAIVAAVFGGWILFVVDLCCILLLDKVLWLDELEEAEAAPAEAAPAEEAPAAEETPAAEEAPAEEAKEE